MTGPDRDPVELPAAPEPGAGSRREAAPAAREDSLVAAWLRTHALLLFGLALAAAAFARAVRFPFSIVDDSSFIVKNPLVAHPLAQGLRGLLTTPLMGYPHTVTVLSLAIDRQLFGSDPAGYHAVNVLLHLVNIVLVHRLLGRLGVTPAVAGRAVLLFAVHPIVTEPVCWVIGRKDLLATGLLVAACTHLLDGRSDGAGGRAQVGRWARASLLAAASMLAKGSTVIAPVILYLVARVARPADSRVRTAAACVPLGLFSATVVLVGAHGLDAQGAFVPRSRGEVLGDALRAWTLHLGHLVLPRGLVPEYERTPGNPATWAVVLAVAVTLAVAGAVLATHPRGSRERMALGFTAVAYAPVAGLLPSWHWTADSYLYLPLVGLVLLIATVADRHRVELRGLTWIAPVLALLSYQHAATWSSARAMFQPVVERYPLSSRALNRLGYAAANDHDPATANASFILLDRLDPDFAFNRGDRAAAWEAAGDPARADAIYARCVRDGDAGCASRLWSSLFQQRRDPRQIAPALLGDAYRLWVPGAGATLDARSLGRIAGWLRAAGIEDLAADAERRAAGRR